MKYKGVFSLLEVKNTTVRKNMMLKNCVQNKWIFDSCSFTELITKSLTFYTYRDEIEILKKQYYLYIMF